MTLTPPEKAEKTQKEKLKKAQGGGGKE